MIPMANRREQLADLCHQHGVASLYSFGSRAREACEWLAGDRRFMAASPSDLDLAAQPISHGPVDARFRVRLMSALEEILGVGRVDLVFLPEVGPFLAADAIRGELLYCDDPDRQAREELLVLRRAGDLEFFQHQRLEGILEGELRS